MAEKNSKIFKKVSITWKNFIDNSFFNSLLERYSDWTENQVGKNFIICTNMASEIQNGRKGTKYSEKLL